MLLSAAGRRRTYRRGMLRAKPCSPPCCGGLLWTFSGTGCQSCGVMWRSSKKCRKHAGCAGVAAAQGISTPLTSIALLTRDASPYLVDRCSEREAASRQSIARCLRTSLKGCGVYARDQFLTASVLHNTIELPFMTLRVCRQDSPV